jgi:hypothetical protein
MQPKGLWLFGHFSSLLARARSTWILPLRSRLESSLRESPSIFSFLLKGQKWPNCLQQMPCDLISASLASGLPYKLIADKLGISFNSVRNSLQHIYKKLRVRGTRAW